MTLQSLTCLQEFVLFWFGLVLGFFFVYFVLLFNLQPAKVVDGYMGKMTTEGRTHDLSR